MSFLSNLRASTDRRHILDAIALAILMALVVGSALGFEHIGGYIPCALCLAQRTPYYIGVPLMVLAVINSALGGPAFVTRGLLLIGGLLMIYGGALGVYHSGVEWHFWPGPATCATAAQGVTTDASDLLGEINSIKPPSCDAAALRVFGLSFAGWNVLASVALAWYALRAGWR